MASLLLKDVTADLNDLTRKVQEQAVNSTKMKEGKSTRKKKKKVAAGLNVTSSHDAADTERLVVVSQNNTFLSSNETLPFQVDGVNATTNTSGMPDPMFVASRMFPRDGGSSSNKMESIHSNTAHYGTTIGLILLLHLVFLHQWNARRSRRDVLTTYHEVVTKKRIHRSVVALVSHPPADSTYLTRERLVSLAIDMGDSNSNSNAPSSNGRLGRIRNRCKSLVESLHPLTYGHLSGLPLLTYNSHILWSCRALEALCPSSWYYAQFLIALALVSFLLELRLTQHALQTTSRVVFGTTVIVDDTSNTRYGSQRAIKHHTMGTPTMISASILLIYYFCFPFVAIPILPFLPVSRRMDVGLSYFISYTILAALSWKSHPFTSVLCGTCSGLLWALGVTSFLGDVYWGSLMVAWIVMASMLSLRVSVGAASLWMPWIDHVAWDNRGRIRYEEPNLDEQAENEPEGAQRTEEEDDVESQPLLNRRESSGLRGRVPLVDMDDDMEMPRTADQSRGLQQRRSGVDSFHHRHE